MNVVFTTDNTVEYLGPFGSVALKEQYIIADGVKIAFFDTKKSLWYDLSTKTMLHSIEISP